MALWHSGQDPVHSAYSVQCRQFHSWLPFLVGVSIYRNTVSNRNDLILASLALSLFFFLLFRVKSAAYESSQARGPIRAAAASLHHSHSNSGPELHLQPILQLTETPARSSTHWLRPEIESTSSWILVRFVTHWAIMGISFSFFFSKKTALSETYAKALAMLDP